MVGAREYANLFKKTQQIGVFYIVVGSHARGKTFSVYLLPEGDSAITNGAGNPPLNDDAVCIYGITGGNHGWTESYGWIHTGKWVGDFGEIVDRFENKLKAEELKSKEESDKAKGLKTSRTQQLLNQYR